MILQSPCAVWNALDLGEECFCWHLGLDARHPHPNSCYSMQGREQTVERFERSEPYVFDVMMKNARECNRKG